MYLKFKKVFSKINLFVLLPAAIVYLISQLFLFDSYTWVPAGILLFYVFHFLGYSIGGHKLFAHRTFEPVPWFPYLTVVIGSICFYSNPVMASIAHRLHHRHVDTDLDPHSPIHGRWHAFFGWLLTWQPSAADARIGADLIRDFPFLKTYRKIDWAVLPVFYITIALISKWLMLACMLGSVLSFLNGMHINAFSHDPSVPGKNKAVNKIFLARFINPVFLQKDHHENDRLYDYSTPEVKDFTAFFIKRFLIKST